MLKRIRTAALEIAYEETGMPDGASVVLLHGFPYDVRAYGEVAAKLSARCRVLVPYLRGFAPTRFLSADTMRSGQQGTLGADLRYGLVEGDPAFDEIERRLAARPPIAVPTVILEGADDGVTPPSAGPPADFTALRRSQIVPGVGHNLPQEAPEAFAAAVLSLI